MAKPVTLGVRRGDHILVIIGNQAELWEILLAVLKLGAVLIPAAPLLSSEDLQDGLERGDVRHVIAAAESTAKFDSFPGAGTCITTAGDRSGWQSLESAAGHSHSFIPDGPTLADDPCLLYFTSGTWARAETRVALASELSRRAPVHHVLDRSASGDLHWNISSPGWAKHAWSCVFAPWNASATVSAYNQRRFNARATLEALAQFGVTTLCAPPTVALAHTGEPGRLLCEVA